jgi:hypothetical protein
MSKTGATIQLVSPPSHPRSDSCSPDKSVGGVASCAPEKAIQRASCTPEKDITPIAACHPSLASLPR